MLALDIEENINLDSMLKQPEAHLDEILIKLASLQFGEYVIVDDRDWED